MEAAWKRVGAIHGQGDCYTQPCLIDCQGNLRTQGAVLDYPVTDQDFTCCKKYCGQDGIATNEYFIHSTQPLKAQGRTIPQPNCPCEGDVRDEVGMDFDVEVHAALMDACVVLCMCERWKS